MKTFTSLSLLAVSLPAHAFTLDDIVHWTGTGSNRAALVVDFANGSPSFVWGYRFSGASTGLSMINAIANDSTSQLSIQVTHYSFGDAITAIGYGANNRQGFDPNSQGYWGYYTADSTLAAPTTWAESQVGAGDRALGNQGWDGWAWAPNFSGSAPSSNLVAAVPEPSTWGVLAGGVMLLRRRRSQATNRR